MIQERRDVKDQGKNASSATGGARADFVASLGRKVEQARDLLGAVEANPADAEPRDELRRRLHALGAGAKMFHFDVMLRTLSEADGVFARIAKAGSMGAADVAEIAQVLDDLPALAWVDTPRASAPSVAVAAPSEPKVLPTRSAVIFGSEMLAEALTDEAYDGTTFECERTEHVEAAMGLVRSLVPDVVLVDADVPAALELVEALLDDPLTEPVPILVTGAFTTPDQAARYVALGVNKTLPKPITPEDLRATCDEAIATREGRTVRVSMGEPTLEQLGERLADEVRQALVESVDRAARTVRVPLGEGSEVLGAIWGAIARVREVVAARTDGAVRFASKGPEGSVQLAPWLHPDVARGDRSTARARGPAVDVRLNGRRVVVADDDPGVTWFLADLLRTAGCEVFEALDGNRALELAYEHSPELVISDILMPGLDGFALCRALRRDVGLRDVPVVLLSWKEDLLQRVRELGANAAAYLRKESDSRAIVARVREVLRARARVEARMKGGGEVRGRIDGITVRSLLELTCATRPNARISVRDASFLYEVEVRDGAPKRIARTAGDGAFERGWTVLAAMLGVGAGRFTVADASGAVEGELHGTLRDLLGPALAQARGAVWATTGARLMTVERVLLDEEHVEAYLRATPEPARQMIRDLAEGRSPRTLILEGGVEPSFLEEVLADVAARGAIVGVVGAENVDLLGPAIERVRALMNGVATSHVPTDAPSSPPAESRSPSSLADAVMHEISARTQTPEHISSPPPIVEPSKLRPRTSSMPPEEHDETVLAERTEVDAVDVAAKEPSIPVVESSKPVAEPVPTPAPKLESTKPAAVAKQERIDRTPMASTAIANESVPPPRATKWTYMAVVAAAAGVVWLALQAGSSSPAEPSASQHEEVSGVIPQANPVATAPAPRAVAPTFAAITTDAGVALGEGLFELSMPGEAPIKVDGAPRGRGPKLALPLKAGMHEVLVGAEEHPRKIEVRAGRATRLDFPETP